MKNFTFYTPTKILFGKGKIEELPCEVAKVAKKVLLAYGGGSVKRIGIYDTLVALLDKQGIKYVELSGIEPNPKITSVQEGVRLCKENGVDAIIALGGGSTIDCCKAIAAGVYYDGDLWQMILDNDIRKALPVFTILTLSATGSEMNGNAVISNMDTNDKKAIKSDLLKPVCSVLDPSYTCSVSRYQTASGVADIMSHIFEVYFSREKGCCVQDNISEALLRTCIKYGKTAVDTPCDYEARANIMWASSLAINGLNSCGGGEEPWSCHSIEHQLSAYYDITHGAGLAVVTPAWFHRILSEDTVDKFVSYGVNVWGLDPQDEPMLIAKTAIAKTRDFFISLGLTTTLRGLGINSTEHFRDMAEKAVAEGLAHAYVPLDADDVVAIYSACM